MQTVKASVFGTYDDQAVDVRSIVAYGHSELEFYNIVPAPDDSGFFDFVSGNVQNGRRFEVELKPVDGLGRLDYNLVVPKLFTDIHRDGVVYVVDTNAPQKIMQPTSISGLNRLYSIFVRKLMEKNPFIGYPCAATQLRDIGLYRGYENSFFRNEPFDPDKMSAEERAAVLESVVNGWHEFLMGHRVHLVVNPSEHVHDPVFQILKKKYGHDVDRFSICV